MDGQGRGRLLMTRPLVTVMGIMSVTIISVAVTLTVCL
jgi:hypothetical protein